MREEEKKEPERQLSSLVPRRETCACMQSRIKDFLFLLIDLQVTTPTPNEAIPTAQKWDRAKG